MFSKGFVICTSIYNDLESMLHSKVNSMVIFFNHQCEHPQPPIPFPSFHQWPPPFNSRPLHTSVTWFSPLFLFPVNKSINLIKVAHELTNKISVFHKKIISRHNFIHLKHITTVTHHSSQSTHQMINR